MYVILVSIFVLFCWCSLLYTWQINTCLQISVFHPREPSTRLRRRGIHLRERRSRPQGSAPERLYKTPMSCSEFTLGFCYSRPKLQSLYFTAYNVLQRFHFIHGHTQHYGHRGPDLCSFFQVMLSNNFLNITLERCKNVVAH